MARKSKTVRAAPKKQLEQWISEFGVVGAGFHDQDFARLQQQFRDLLLPLTNRVSFRDLYTIADQAAAGAVGCLVAEHVNSRKHG